jgi:hypothetical protein
MHTSTNYLRANYEAWEIAAQYHQTDLSSLSVSKENEKIYALPNDKIKFIWSKELQNIKEQPNILLRRELTKGSDKYLTFSVYINEEGILVVFGKMQRAKEDFSLLCGLTTIIGGMALISGGPASILFGAGLSGLIYGYKTKDEDFDGYEGAKQVALGGTTSFFGGFLSKAAGPVISSTLGSKVVTSVVGELSDDILKLACPLLATGVSGGTTNAVCQIIRKNDISQFSVKEALEAWRLWVQILSLEILLIMKRSKPQAIM